MISTTLSLGEASRQLWDVIVVGAGPAGAFAAHQLARRMASVLLVDKASFPRWKVCGCCLNGSALSILQSAGLGQLVENLGSVSLREVVLASGGHRALLPLPAGMALSREALDAGLVQAAQNAGVNFLPATYARLGHADSSSREIILRQRDQEIKTRTRLVLAADGLGGRFLATALCNNRPIAAIHNDLVSLTRRWDRRPACPKSPMGGTPVPVGWKSKGVRSSRIGAGAIATNGPSFYHEGTIFMACSAGGYVGVVRLEDGRLAVAAAFDPAFVKAMETPSRAASAILRQVGLAPISSISEVPWRGTPPLTRRATSVASNRLFVLGDAAGFVEPFTGEGIAWALASGAAVTPLAVRAIQSWEPSLQHQWTAAYKDVVARRQWACRAAASLLRRPRLTGVLVRILSALPSLATPIIGLLNRPMKLVKGNNA